MFFMKPDHGLSRPTHTHRSLVTERCYTISIVVFGGGVFTD